MLPKIHFILGIIFVAILYFFFSPIISPFGLAIILLSSVFIDADHYVYYVFRKKNLNPFKSHEWYIQNVRKVYSLNKENREKVYLGLYFFHGVESLITLFIFGIFYPIFTFVLIGFIFHLTVDFISEIILKDRLDKISFIYNIFAFKKLINIEDLKIR